LIGAIVSKYSISVPKTHHSAAVMIPPEVLAVTAQTLTG
jgi:hypothetical protein